MKAYCQETFRWIHFGRSEALNSISLWRGKNFSAINFLKQESWKQRAETGESENFAFQGQWNWSDHCDLGRTKNLSFMVKALYLQSSGRTNNC